MTELRQKRPLDVDSLVQAGTEIDDDGVRKRVRRHEFSAMTQYNSVGDGEDVVLPPPGFIRKISLKNFMCHRNFDVELGPGLNFIVGKNGSGKSAILTAITIGLGAKASDTNRGSSLKDLITSGCNSSKITIYLSNEGIGAYVPKEKEYGKTIIIERTISRNAAASFSLKSENGSEISNKKKDLQEILDYFSIPISNPMCFLSQDAARSFLTASTPSDKYNHFVKGTLLKQIEEHLERAKSVHNESTSVMELHTESLRDLQQNYEKAKNDLKQISKTSDLNERLKLLTGKALWLSVDENNSNIQKLQENINKYQHEIAKLNDKIISRQQQIDNLREDIENFEAEIPNRISIIKEKEEGFQLINEKIRESKAEYEEEENNEKEIIANIKRCQKFIAKLDQSIADLQSKQEQEQGGDKENMLKEMENLKIENGEIRQNIDAFNTKIQDVNTEIRELISERGNNIKLLENQINEKRREINDTRQGKSTFLRNFDNNMEYLMRTLESRKSEFSTPPIGPLGNYVSLRSGFEEWAPSIQRYLTTTLSSFIVATHKDNELLRKIMHSCKIRTSNFPVITYKLSLVRATNPNNMTSHPTIIQALEFKKNELSVVFCDMNKIDKVVLIKNMDDARRFLLSSNQNDISMALSIRDDSYGYQLTGGTRIDTVKYQEKVRLKVGESSEDNIAYIQNIIRKYETELRDIKSRYSERIENKKSELNDLNDEVTKCGRLYRINNEKIVHLKTNLSKEVDTGKLNTQIEERKNQVIAIESYKDSRTVIQEKLVSMVQKLQPLQEQYNSHKRELASAEEELHEKKTSIKTTKDKILKYHDHIKELQISIKDYQTIIPKTEANVKDLEAGVAVQEKNAEEVCSRSELLPDLPDNQEEIKHELKAIQVKLREAEKMMGMTQQQIVNNYSNAKKKFADASNKYKIIENVLEKLTKSIKLREQNLERTQQITFFEADNDFKSSMRIRKFAGHLDFNKRDKKLGILILTPNDDKYREVSTFSGGEKSYSQMALLLATWRPMRSRLIALDEFDVFMDQVNRKIGSKLIVKKLKDIPGTQTIIITPQDIGGIAEIDDSVHILKMKDPKRH
ncbi:Structural maintenance of chromosomes protein 6 [Nakaseomyces bracarensis]|uniref:Structural maintenance of chromosomes protein 6 n=1 Tax=Nakaseomyces bracarensis TaxID=273131 RepID=A0ABR4NX62_9SACH